MRRVRGRPHLVRVPDAFPAATTVAYRFQEANSSRDGSGKANNSEQKWMKELVVCLWNLKSSDWYNSIVDLPEGTNEMDKDLLLLWKQNKHFDALFMTESDRNSPSPRRRSVIRDSPPLGLRSAAKRDNTPTSIGKRGGKKLLYEDD